MNRSMMVVSLVGIMAFVGLVGSSLDTDRAAIRTNAKILHLQIEACTATTAGMTIPDVQTLRSYLRSYNVVLKSIDKHVPSIYEARDENGDDIIIGPDDDTPHYGDFVLIRPTNSSYELRYVGKDGENCPAFSQ